MSVRATSEVESGLRPADRCGRSKGRSWLISLFAHMVILLLLAFHVMPGFSQGSVILLQGVLSNNDALAPVFSLSPKRGGEAVPNPSHVDSPVTVPLSTTFVKTTGSEIASSGLIDPASIELLAGPSGSEVAESRARSRHTSGIRAIRQSTTMSDAVFGVGDSLSGELMQGDTLIVWLLDASNSLEDKRESLAWYAGELYRSIDVLDQPSERASPGHVLLSSVIAFGRDWQEIVKPTAAGSQAIDAMYDIPADPTGRENIMSAVGDIVDLYRNQRDYRQRMLIAVLTDESGDDTEATERTIDVCRQAGVAVHVIGPTAVLGSRQAWQHRALQQSSINYSFWLAVHRGPETPLPERLCLPYWHQSALPPWQGPGARSVEGGEWYGGPYRERILSGFGPHALTRLALQTGGTYTLFDGDDQGYRGGEYKLQALRDYIPTYESDSAYLASISGNPLRQFVIDAAALSLDQADLFTPPRTIYFAERSPYYPFNIRRTYRTPSDFRSQFPLALSSERTRISNASERLKDLIGLLHDPSIDWHEELGKEDSRRWRAWFDLSKGRLLATQARYLEYLAATDEAAAAIGPETNSVKLLPTQSTRVAASSTLIREATESLQRCIEMNPETPWEAMARWELEQPFGLRIEQSIVPKPGQDSIETQTTTPTEFVFPNL